MTARPDIDAMTETPERQEAGLLPCPFCGSVDIMRDPSADCTATPCVTCIKCGAHVTHHTQADADELWNTRAALAQMESNDG